MWSVTVIILIAFVVQAHATASNMSQGNVTLVTLVTNHTGNVRNVLVDRVLKTSPFHHVDLDRTVLSKDEPSGPAMEKVDQSSGSVVVIEKVDPSCQVILKAFLGSMIVPVPGFAVIPGSILAVCCPGEIVKRYEQIKSHFGASRKTEAEKLWEEVLAPTAPVAPMVPMDPMTPIAPVSATVQADATKQAQLHRCKSIQAAYDSEQATIEYKQFLENSHPWLLYPKLVELYRFWPLEMACEKIVLGKLIEMREECEHLPEFTRRPDFFANFPLPPPLEDVAQTTVSDSESGGNMLVRARKQMCSKIASGLNSVSQWSEQVFASEPAESKTMEPAEAETLRQKFCPWDVNATYTFIAPNRQTNAEHTEPWVVRVAAE